MESDFTDFKSDFKAEMNSENSQKNFKQNAKKRAGGGEKTEVICTYGNAKIEELLSNLIEI